MEKSKTFRNLFAIIKWECYNKQTCRVEIDSAVILVLSEDNASTIIETLNQRKIDLFQLKAIRCNGTAVNSGHIGEFFCFIEFPLSRSLQWFVRMLHASE